MTDGERETTPVSTAPGATVLEPVPSGSEAALARYRSSMRRKSVVYYSVLAVLVVAIAVGVTVAWSRGEAAHASLRTISTPPASVAITAASPTQQESWHTTDRIALGVPTWGGTVVTFSTHSVGGRNARTGTRTWEYTRSDRTVCTASQQAGTTIAVFGHAGNCDEVNAFDSGTGQRRWTRTLDMDGMPVNGPVTYQVTPFTLLVASHDVIYAVDPVTGYNRWTYQRYGCRIEHVALGNNGALISQDCSTKVRCTKVKFCEPGQQLMLRDAMAARGDDSKPNADQIKWNRIGDDTVPVSADSIISAVQPGGAALQVLDPSSGHPLHSVALKPVTSQLGAVTAIATSSAELVWIGGRTYALGADSSSPTWSAVSAAPPTVTSTVSETSPALDTARISVATPSGISILSGTDGRTVDRFRVQTPEPGSLVYPLGTGFLVAGPAGIAAYR